MPIIGVIENMSGFICPHCGTRTDIFQSSGGHKIAEEMKVPFLGTIPIDPRISQDSDKGESFIVEQPDSPASGAFREIARNVEEFLKGKERQDDLTHQG